MSATREHLLEALKSAASANTDYEGFVRDLHAQLTELSWRESDQDLAWLAREIDGLMLTIIGREIARLEEISQAARALNRQFVQH